MPEKIKELLNKVMEWWNKFSAKQKTFIVAAGAGVVLAISILLTVLMQPQYIQLLVCEDTKEASEVSDLLTEAGLDFKISDDGLQIKVNKKQQSDARLLMGANNIQAADYTIQDVTEGSFTVTESDKQRKNEYWLETRLANDMISRFSSVKSAVVDLYIPEQTGTLIASEEESSAWVLLEIDGEFTTDNAAFLAKAVATSLGNETEENIVIMDYDGNMLFSGGENYSASGTASSQLSVKTQWEKQIKNEIKQVLLGTNEFDKVEVTSNLDIDFSSATSTDHEYYVADGNTQGYLSSESIYNAESTNGGGGVPGTDANGDVEYEYQDNEESTSTETEEQRNYLPSERITDRETPPGSLNYGNSSIAIAAVSLNVVREEDVKAQGLLDGITWEEYKIANSERTPIDIDEGLFDVVSKSTGFSTDNIAIRAYQENVFFDAEGLNISATDVVQIVLIVVILGLLAFVVLRSLRTAKEVEQPEELSVETLLQSQPQQELEDIGVGQESETRRMIDKFVDENPEAAANLLRNWLNEEWG